MRCAPLLPLALLLTPIGLLASDASPPAVVDLQAVFQAHPRTTTATDELTSARDAARKRFRAASAELKNSLQRHQELLREGRREEAAAELGKANTLERSIAELGTTNERNLEERFRRAKAEIMEDILRAVRELNAERRHPLVLDKSAASANGLPQVVDAPGAVDITAEVIQRVKK